MSALQPSRSHGRLGMASFLQCCHTVVNSRVIYSDDRYRGEDLPFRNYPCRSGGTVFFEPRLGR